MIYRPIPTKLQSAWRRAHLHPNSKCACKFETEKHCQKHMIYFSLIRVQERVKTIQCQIENEKLIIYKLHRADRRVERDPFRNWGPTGIKMNADFRHSTEIRGFSKQSYKSKFKANYNIPSTPIFFSFCKVLHR